MDDGQVFPDFFFLRAPLPEKVDPITLVTKNQIYWGLSIRGDSRNSEPKPGGYLAPYDDNDTDLLDCCDLEDNYEINPTKSGKFITSFYVPTLLHSVIVGPRGAKLRELQDNTNTLIKVPKPDEEPFVKITGQSERSVASARTQITLLVLSKREKLPMTHFVSIPVISDSIRENFGKFKNDILTAPPTRGIDETIFQKAGKFHLTIVTLALLDDKEIEKTKELLRKCQNSIQKIFNGKKARIIMRGVEIMNDDPSEVDVLYGKVHLDDVEGADLLQEVANEIFEQFSKNGLTRKQYDNVKLHVTLMNSLFRKNDGFQKLESNENKRESFDASYILEKYRDFYFGQSTLNKIHLSVRYTTAQNGYYESAIIITI